jgi:hypothetical protein
VEIKIEKYIVCKLDVRVGQMNDILNERYKRAADALIENSIDAWITLGRETHILGEPAMLFLTPMNIFRNTAIILTSAGKRICVCNSIESEEINDSGLFTDIIVYKTVTDFEETLTKVLASLMSAQKIALNFSQYDPSSDGLTYSQYLLLQRVFKNIDYKGTTVSSEPLMKKVRSKKSDTEVEKIKKAACNSLKLVGIIKPYKPLMPLEIKLELYRSDMCDKRMEWDTVIERLDARTVRKFVYKIDSFKDILI